MRARTSLGRFKIRHTNKTLDGYKIDIDRNLQKTEIVAVSVVVLFSFCFLPYACFD